MISQKLNPHDIYAYLSSKNFNLSSDKIFREQHPNQDTIWAILSFLSTPFNNQTYEQIEPMLVYLLDPDIYLTALKKMKQYITLSILLNKISPNQGIGANQYPIKDIVKPEREKVLQKISSLINFNKHNERVSKKYQSLSFQNQMLKNTLKQYRQSLDQKICEIEEVKQMKERQKQQCQQKVKAIENISKEISYKKKEKLDLLNSQQELNNQLNKKKKQIDEGTYLNDDQQIQIKRLERQIIQNAPKLKKDRIAIIEEFQKFRDSFNHKEDFYDKHTLLIKRKLKEVEGITNRACSSRIESIDRQLKDFQRNVSKINSNLLSNDSLKGHKLQEKLSLIGRIQNREMQYKKTLQLNNELKAQNKKIKQSLSKVSYELKKYEHIIQILQEKIRVQKSHEDQLKERYRRKKQTFDQQIKEKKLVLHAMEKEMRSIVSNCFEDFVS